VRGSKPRKSGKERSRNNGRFKGGRGFESRFLQRRVVQTPITLEHRVGDRRVIRVIRKWLKAGVMEDGEVTRPEVGTPQGGVIAS